MCSLNEPRCLLLQAHSQLPLFRSERRRGLGRGGAFKPENDVTLQNESEHPLPRPLSRSCVAGEGRKMQSKLSRVIRVNPFPLSRFGCGSARCVR